MKTILLTAMTAIAMAGATVTAQAAEVKKPAEVSIPFVNHGGIRDWRADGRDAILIEDQHHQWYRATFMGSCLDLPYADTIGFETRGFDTFDRFGTVVVRGHRCPVTSLEKTAPPKKKSDKKHGIEKVTPAAPGAPAA